MREKTAITAALMLALAGCQTFETMDAGLAGLKGRSYQTAFDVLGFPDGEKQIAGKRVFTWANQNSGSYSVPTYNQSTAWVNGSPVQIQSQGTATESYDYHCRIDVIVNDKGIVEDTKYDGNIGGCERWAAKMKAKRVK
ncbi:hypothetical protein [Agrobacterium vitis]|uniref:hypothetical protein n=1 Tax=Agrobacterium vitis TaxID=373 RepID=UPI00114CB416|nr:hypothetical protein [Agrobacterium vitis]MCM2451928.1 hypothetical protein [Agrobacterium vitis]MCM2471125.1 hypothetical protein [Agrobacterium vitis]MUO70118.1 hypothetical protein [Agrobacterium vitis]